MLTLVAALVFALVVRGSGVIIGIALLFIVFVPIEKLFALRPQRVFRHGLATDLTHLLVTNFFVTIGTVVVAIVIALPLLWVRRFHLIDALPTAISAALALPLLFVANYWGHRLSHQVPLLWRFHSVHHSIQEMDWVASARVHPLDLAFTNGLSVAPLLVLGYGGGAFAGVALFFTFLGVFQHANVRLRFPVVRWLLPTPEWHHWHHATDAAAIDTNFGLPAIDKLFGTAYLPRHVHPSGFGISDPVPSEGYLRHLAYPFTTAARPVG